MQRTGAAAAAAAAVASAAVAASAGVAAPAAVAAAFALKGLSCRVSVRVCMCASVCMQVWVCVCVHARAHHVCASYRCIMCPATQETSTAYGYVCVRARMRECVCVERGEGVVVPGDAPILWQCDAV